MVPVRSRLTDAQLAALARYGFGLTTSPPEMLPEGDELEDAEGVLVATRDGDRLDVREVPRWRSPESVRDQLFEPFVTTKSAGEGSGLGLDNARRIVERRHGGSLSFRTGPAGTTFCVRLPAGRR